MREIRYPSEHKEEKKKNDWKRRMRKMREITNPSKRKERKKNKFE